MSNRQSQLQIADWLEKLGMAEYAQRFAEHRTRPSRPGAARQDPALDWDGGADRATLMAALAMSDWLPHRADPINGILDDDLDWTSSWRIGRPDK